MIEILLCIVFAIINRIRGGLWANTFRRIGVIWTGFLDRAILPVAACAVLYPVIDGIEVWVAMLTASLASFMILGNHGQFQDLGSMRQTRLATLHWPAAWISRETDGSRYDVVGLALSGVVFTLPLGAALFYSGNDAWLLVIAAGLAKPLGYATTTMLEWPGLNGGEWFFGGVLGFTLGHAVGDNLAVYF